MGFWKVSTGRCSRARCWGRARRAGVAGDPRPTRRELVCVCPREDPCCGSVFGIAAALPGAGSALKAGGFCLTRWIQVIYVFITARDLLSDSVPLARSVKPALSGSGPGRTRVDHQPHLPMPSFDPSKQCVFWCHVPGRGFQGDDGPCEAGSSAGGPVTLL